MNSEGKHCTVRGRVVYNRKIHYAKPKDAERIFKGAIKHYSDPVTLSIDCYEALGSMTLAFFEQAAELSTIDIGKSVRQLLLKIFTIGATVDTAATLGAVSSINAALYKGV